MTIAVDLGRKATKQTKTIRILENKMLFTYLIKRTDLKKSLYVNKFQILFFYSSMCCWHFPLMTINGSLMAKNVPLAV